MSGSVLPPLHPCRLSVAALATLLAVSNPTRAAASHVAAQAATHASAPAPVSTPTLPAIAPTRPIDPLESLREKLARKLSGTATTSAYDPGTVHIVSRASSELPAPTAAPAGRRSHRAKAHPSATTAHRPGATAHWSYSGASGPQAWAELAPEFTTCATGSRQSPIDIRDGLAVDLDPIDFDYHAGPFAVIDNGHTVQVNVAPGNSIQVLGRRFELVQFHFHRPSEEHINGRQFDMVVHLVHKDPTGRLAVVAVLLERGSNAQPLVQTIWNNLPLEKGEEVAARASLDLNLLLPRERGYYTYMGSLTTPPCTEGVLWMVMQQPVTTSPEQIDIFARLYPMNARPLQAASGRLIKQSN